MSGPKQALIRGAMWTVATRWAIKGIGFLNTVVMARLLVPADYGVVAMANRWRSRRRLVLQCLAHAKLDCGRPEGLKSTLLNCMQRNKPGVHAL